MAETFHAISSAGFDNSETSLQAQFETAVSKGDISDVYELLAVGHASPTAFDVHANREKIFRLACRQGHVGVVQALLDLEANMRIDVHALGEDALNEACAHGHVDVVRFLLALPGDRRMGLRGRISTAFRAACTQGQVAVIQLLLASQDSDRRVDVHAQHCAAFRAACCKGHTAAVRELLALKGDQQVDANVTNGAALYGACVAGHAAVVRLLLALQGAREVDVRASGDAAWKAACAGAHAGVMLELLSLAGTRAVPMAVFLRAALRELPDADEVFYAERCAVLDAALADMEDGDTDSGNSASQPHCMIAPHAADLRSVLCCCIQQAQHMRHGEQGEHLHRFADWAAFDEKVARKVDMSACSDAPGAPTVFVACCMFLVHCASMPQFASRNVRELLLQATATHASSTASTCAMVNTPDGLCSALGRILRRATWRGVTPYPETVALWAGRPARRVLLLCRHAKQ